MILLQTKARHRAQKRDIGGQKAPYCLTSFINAPLAVQNQRKNALQKYVLFQIMLLCKQRNLKISPDIYECSSMTLPPNKRYFLDFEKD